MAATPSSVKQAYDLAQSAFQAGNSIKHELVDELLLIDPSLLINYESTWEQIFTVISSSGLGGIRSVSGTSVSSSSNSAFQIAGGTSTTNISSVTVTGLPFKPKKVVIKNLANSRMTVFDGDLNDQHYQKTAKVFTYGPGYSTSSVMGNFKADVSPAFVIETGFCLPFYSINLSVEWTAYTWMD